jgi:hypothetical protein
MRALVESFFKTMELQLSQSVLSYNPQLPSLTCFKYFPS